MTLPVPDTPLEGASNFRDLGGYRTTDGRRVRVGQVFRSDHLAALTARDRRTLGTLGVTHSVDFRGETERAALPYALPGLTALPFTIEPTVVARMRERLEAGRVPSTEETVELMRETYRDFVHQHAHTFGRFLRLLAAQETPLVFHCTAGKDRTGFAAALLLTALGVDRATVEHDYLLTNRLYRRSPQVEGHAPEHVLAVLWQVQPAFLAAAYEAMERRHGGLEGYLDGPVGLTAADRRRLRDRLLVPGESASMGDNAGRGRVLT
jgi:protein-tyrosine phosphatase